MLLMLGIDSQVSLPPTAPSRVPTPAFSRLGAGRGGHSYVPKKMTENSRPLDVSTVRDFTLTNVPIFLKGKLMSGMGTSPRGPEQD
jgi:hypothetical protein